MPTPSELLEQLALAANQLAALAIVWHVAIVIVSVALIRRSQLPAQYAAVLLVAPAVSVFLVSMLYGSWFNGGSFFVLAFGLAVLTVDYQTPWRARGPVWSIALGIALVAYGSVYPHFVEGAWYRAVYAAPIGVLPCPTLAIIAGFTLVTGAHGTRAVPAFIAVWTAFYAVFGIAKLGVWLDLGLGAATIGLVTLAVHNSQVTPSRAGARWRGPVARRRS